jgi:hypothetical protein
VGGKGRGTEGRKENNAIHRTGLERHGKIILGCGHSMDWT